MQLRFPQLAVRCAWCHAPAGDLCTNPATRRTRGHDTHDIRLRTWVIETATCTDCEAAPGSPCTTSTGKPLTTLVHPARDEAATRAYTAQQAHTQQLSLSVGVTRLADHHTQRKGL